MALLRRIAATLWLAGFACLAVFLAFVSERAWFQWRYGAMISTRAPANAKLPPVGPLGRIEIPRLGVSAVILDGIDAATLRRGVGHVPGTAYPGESGRRIGLAAHRDTFFRNLRLIRAGDTVRLSAPGITELYTVEAVEVVRPWQIDVLQPIDKDYLTLLTCFPFTYVGNAPDRFVVQARRVVPRLAGGGLHRRGAP